MKVKCQVCPEVDPTHLCTQPKINGDEEFWLSCYESTKTTRRCQGQMSKNLNAPLSYQSIKEKCQFSPEVDPAHLHTHKHELLAPGMQIKN